MIKRESAAEKLKAAVRLRPSLPLPSQSDQIPFYKLVAKPYSLPPISIAEDHEEIIDLARICFSRDVLPFVLRSFEDMLASFKIGKVDGRRYTKLVHNKKIIGICGIHKLPWHEDDTCMAGWFFAKPVVSNAIIPRILARSMVSLAREEHCSRLIIESVSDDDNHAIVDFLIGQGLTPCHTFKNFYGRITHLTLFDVII